MLSSNKSISWVLALLGAAAALTVEAQDCNELVTKDSWVKPGVSCQFDDMSVSYDMDEKSLILTNEADEDTKPYSISMFVRQHTAAQAGSYWYNFSPNSQLDGRKEINLEPKNSMYLKASDDGVVGPPLTLYRPNDVLKIEELTATREESCGLMKVVKGNVDASIVGDVNNTKSWAINLSTSLSTMFYKFPANCTTEKPTNPPTIIRDRLLEAEDKPALKLAS